MIKKIRIDQVVAGVYVHDFNCGWLHHPFLVNQIKLNTDKDVEKILKYGIRELYIDTEKGLDIDAAPTKPEADSEIQTEVDQLSMPIANSEQPSRLSEEITRAKKLITEAKRTTQRLMGDVRLGKQIEMHQVEKIVEQMTESVLNNKDALVSLLRIKTADEYTYTHSLATHLDAACTCVTAHHHERLDGTGYPEGKSGYIGVVIDHGEKGSLTPVVRAVCDAVQRRPIKPFVIDLGIQRQIGNEHDIVGCEAPEKWHVKPEQYF